MGCCIVWTGLVVYLINTCEGLLCLHFSTLEYCSLTCML